MKKGIFLFGALALFVGSCIKHEVIPAPEPVVELDCYFEGTIGGAYIEYTQNVTGYAPFPSIAKQTQFGVTNAQYLFAIQSSQVIPKVQISLGSLSWNDPTGIETPALSLFNTFFTSNDNPNYSNAAINGFEFAYTDNWGDTWRSYKDSIPQNVSFVPSSIIQESDESGDYSKFIVNFECPIYHIYSVPDITVIPQTNPLTMRDSVAKMVVTNATMRGYFKR